MSEGHWSLSPEEHFRAAHQAAAQIFSLDQRGESATTKTNVAFNKASRTSSDCGSLALMQNEIIRGKKAHFYWSYLKNVDTTKSCRVSSSSVALFVFCGVSNCAQRNFWSLATCSGLFYHFSKNNVSIGTTLPWMHFCIN